MNCRVIVLQTKGRRVFDVLLFVGFKSCAYFKVHLFPSYLVSVGVNGRVSLAFTFWCFHSNHSMPINCYSWGFSGAGV